MTIPAGFILTQRGLIATSPYQPAEHQPPNPEEVNICRQWLAAFAVPAEQMNTRAAYHAEPITLTSYGAKHRVELWTEEQFGKRQHIFQGALIQAAMDMGYEVQPIVEQGRTRKSMEIHLWLREDDWKRVWPTGFTRWLFAQREDNTYIGELAREAFTDKQWPRRAERFSEYNDYLLRRHTDPDILSILREAWSYYSGEELVIGS
jgi:uncharacterized protein YozE (UPF0346 family)